jgi:hypothetical protein
VAGSGGAYCGHSLEIRPAGRPDVSARRLSTSGPESLGFAGSVLGDANINAQGEWGLTWWCDARPLVAAPGLSGGC